jgi:hypothetical protein
VWASLHAPTLEHVSRVVSIQRIPVRDNVDADRPLPHGVVAIAPENTAGAWLSTCGYGENSLPILLMRC